VFSGSLDVSGNQVTSSVGVSVGEDEEGVSDGVRDNVVDFSLSLLGVSEEDVVDISSILKHGRVEESSVQVDGSLVGVGTRSARHSHDLLVQFGVSISEEDTEFVGAARNNGFIETRVWSNEFVVLVTEEVSGVFVDGDGLVFSNNSSSGFLVDAFISRWSAVVTDSRSVDFSGISVVFSDPKGMDGSKGDVFVESDISTNIEISIWDNSGRGHHDDLRVVSDSDFVARNAARVLARLGKQEATTSGSESKSSGIGFSVSVGGINVRGQKISLFSDSADVFSDRSVKDELVNGEDRVHVWDFNVEFDGRVFSGEHEVVIDELAPESVPVRDGAGRGRVAVGSRIDCVGDQSGRREVLLLNKEADRSSRESDLVFIEVVAVDSCLDGVGSAGEIHWVSVVSSDVGVDLSGERGVGIKRGILSWDLSNNCGSCEGSKDEIFHSVFFFWSEDFRRNKKSDFV